MTEPNCPADENGNGKNLGFSTRAVHEGEARQKPGDSITDPIYCTATYTFPDMQSVYDFAEKKIAREEYARYGNPSEKTAERKLAALDGAEEAVLYSSGMSAVVGLLMATLQAGDEVVLFDECYHHTREFLTKTLARFGVAAHRVPSGDFEAMEAKINSRTKLLMSETPTNPHLSVVDLKQFAALGKKYGVATVIDSTLATPFNSRPREYGIDYILHSCTKYLAGHNDILGGVVIGDAAKIEPLRKLRGIMGAVNSPHNIYLLLRGLKTFELRMQRHNENGQAVAEFLENHPRVEKVLYPGLKSHRQHELACSQMIGFGGLLTFTIKNADMRETSAVIDRVRLPRIGPSLGGVESLIEQPVVQSFLDYTPEARREIGIEDNMIRLACGIENPEDLIADLKQSLER